MSDDPRERYQSFLEGNRPSDVAVFLHESIVDSVASFVDRDLGVRRDDGVVLVLPGDAGRTAFRRATGLEAMKFAGEAMDTQGKIDDDVAGGTCPNVPSDEDTAETERPDTDHEVRFVFAFVEAENVEAGGIYAEGPVLHAYAGCECGTTYSDRWDIED